MSRLASLSNRSRFSVPRLVRRTLPCNSLTFSEVASRKVRSADPRSCASQKLRILIDQRSNEDFADANAPMNQCVLEKEIQREAG